VKRNFLLCAVLIAGLGLAGCSSYQKAVTVYTVVESVLAVANAELPNLPVQDQGVARGLTVAVGGLNDQYKSCIDNAESAMLSTKGKFVACLNLFATGLADPKELANLRVLSPATQAKVQLYVTAVQAGINAGLAFFGSGSTQAAPQVGSAPPTTKAELTQFRKVVGL
jgi:hypothetical protein